MKNNPQFFYKTALLLTVILMTVWPMPGTIAIRNSALLLLFMMVLFDLRGKGCLQSASVSIPRGPLGLYLSLTAWICIVILVWGQDQSQSWNEFVPQWLLPLVIAVVAWRIVVWVSRFGQQQALIKTLFFSFLGAVILQDVMSAFYFWETGNPPFRQASILYIPRLIQGMSWQQAFDGNFGEKFSFVNNMFVALVLAEAGQRLLTTKRWLQVSNLVLVISLLAAGLCSYWLSFRNGNIGLLALLFFFGVLLIFAHKDKYGILMKLISVSILLALMSGLAFLVVKSDQRWQTFSETAVVALKGDSTAWIWQKDYPSLPNGETVEVSAYERISWIKEGVKMSMRHPMGTGFNRSAFFDTLDRENQLDGQRRGGHSHSGILDFMIANGIPGAGLWIAFLASCVWVGWGMVRQGNVAQGLTIVFLVTGFFNRGLVDSNIRDHVLQQFLFLLTIYMTIQLAPVSRLIVRK